MIDTSSDAETLLKEGFAILSAREFLNDPYVVRDAPGVYIILLQGAADIFTLACFDAMEISATWRVRGHDHIYTGESVGVRSRLLHHLLGTIRLSNFRHSLLALEFVYKALWGSDEADLSKLEQRFSEWIIPRALLAYKICPLIGEVEANIIKRSSSPLNIKGRARSPATLRLKRARAALTDHVRSTGQLGKAISKPRSAWLLDSVKYQRAG